MSKKLAKRVSNYELFFDLSMVMAISSLTSSIHVDHLGFSNIFAFVMTNVILLNVWYNELFYYNKYGDSRTADIFTVVALMFVMGNLALNFNIEMDNMTAGSSMVIWFNGLLIVAYLIIALQFFLKGRKLGFNDDIKVHILRLLLAAASLIPFAIGLIGVTDLTAIIYLIPFVNHYVIRFDHEAERAGLNFPHMMERMQLMTILAFGEAVIAIIKTYPLSSQPINGILLFLAMAFLFMFYMSQTFLSVDHHSEREASLLFFAHLFIFLGINFFTVGIEFLADHHHASMGHWLYLAGVMIYFIGVLSTAHYNQDLYRLDAKGWLSFIFLILLGGAAIFLAGEHIWLQGLIVIILGNGISRLNMLFRRKVRERNNIAHPDPSQNLRDFS
ncbi:low temperature requirement protein A [Streptococcus loxodontisalivarius]|uniref:Low temperature requirement protein LtrA n=1 Tax=Streptococcus loxodontisalivarius TaxID=1349415 RepID=A0ABS2PRL3_9STRE|nr:low temperature requirement protein A [Streptococcus loxodontisalivarius]MBM7642678.1 low temperature requirement protein LtrA [Streptococcus loxodontisalivarius]